MIVLNPGVGGNTLGTNLVSGIDWQVVNVGFGTVGATPTQVSAANPLPVTGSVAVTSIAGSIPVTGAVTVSGGPVSITEPVTVELSDGSGTPVSSLATGTVQALAVALVNATGQQITAFGGNGGVAETDASTYVRGTALTNPVAAVVDTNAPTLTAGTASGLSMDTSGNLRVSLQAGGAAAGTAGSPSSDVLTIQGAPSMTPLQVTMVPQNAPQNAGFRVKAVAGTNATVAANTANSILLSYALYNNAATPRYFKFYNSATTPVVGTATPFFTVILAPGGGANISFGDGGGITFSAGISFGITGGIADGDTTSVAADDVHGILLVT
jgi:hypothetical protein